MTEEKVITRHPLGKSNKPITRQNYELFEAAIISALRDRELTHTKLVDQLAKSLQGLFSGNISWCAMTVKLDMEARNLIERTHSKPQKYRLR